MEAWAALGAAANILQFAETAFNITKSVLEAYQSADGLIGKNLDIEATGNELSSVITTLDKGDTSWSRGAPELKQLVVKSLDAAEKLQRELDALKFTSSSIPGERLRKFVVAMRAVRRKGKVCDLQQRVVEIRQQVLVRLQVLVYQERRSLAESLRVLEDSSKKSQDWNVAHTRKLDDMGKGLEKLLASQSDWQDSQAELRRFLVELTKFTTHVQKHEIITSILKSLHFKQLRLRQSEIPVAHRNTFEWIFDGDVGLEFRTWLQEGRGVFWITGKPGSGKSTLMKFLLGHPKMHSLLTEWGWNELPIIASHFFWSVGSSLQQSQEGCLRTLLFQILISEPGLIPDVCPERFNSGFRHLESWTLDELSAVFTRLRNSKKKGPFFRLFLFIDGLDEYRGEPAYLVKFITDLTAGRSDIKVCCASRPWIEFEKGFKGAEGQLHIHHLTTEDIRLYVRETLEAGVGYGELRARQPVEAQELIEQVTSRAEGVFFWVFLVVRSLLRGLGREDDIGTLHKRLMEFPSDLDQFFSRMLQSVETVHKERAFMVFNSLLITDSSLPLDVFSALDTLGPTLALYDANQRFFQTPNPKNSSEEKAAWRVFVDAESIFPDLSRVEAFDRDPAGQRRRLLAQCSDLVHCWALGTEQTTESELAHIEDPPTASTERRMRDSTEGSVSRYRVGFIHRTVADFLHTPGAKALIAGNHPLEYFVFILCRAFLQRGALLHKEPELSFIWMLYLATRYPSYIVSLIVYRFDTWSYPIMGDTNDEKSNKLRTQLNRRRPGKLAHSAPRLGVTHYLYLFTKDFGDATSLFFDLCLEQALKPALEIEVPGDGTISYSWSESADLEQLKLLLEWPKNGRGALTISPNAFGILRQPNYLNLRYRSLEDLVTYGADKRVVSLEDFDFAPGTAWLVFLRFIVGQSICPSNAGEVAEIVVNSGLLWRRSRVKEVYGGLPATVSSKGVILPTADWLPSVMKIFKDEGFDEDRCQALEMAFKENWLGEA